MRTTLWCTILTTTLLVGTACKTRETEKASAEMMKTQEVLDLQEKRTAEDLTKLAKDEARVDAARADFANATMIRLSKIDSRIDVIAAKPDQGSREAAATLNGERDRLFSKLHMLTTQDLSQWTNDQWKAMRKDVERSFERIEHQLDDLT